MSAEESTPGNAKCPGCEYSQTDRAEHTCDYRESTQASARQRASFGEPEQCEHGCVDGIIYVQFSFGMQTEKCPVHTEPKPGA